MQTAPHFLSALALMVLSVSAQAASTTYTSSTSFLAQVASGAYTETFNGLGDRGPGPIGFSGGAFAYSAFAPQDLYFGADTLATNQIDEALTISFTGSSVKAIGANFYAVNISGVFQPVSLTLTLSDGTVTSFTPSSVSDSYRGFVSDIAITSLVVSAPGQSLYGGLDNLTVGTTIAAVPEPGSWALMGLGLAGLYIARRRKV